MKKNILTALLLIVVAVVSRLIPHLPNMTPIAAMALFGGVYLDKKYAFVLPLAAMFVSDLVLGFHSGVPYVYGSFVLMGFVGFWLRQHHDWGSRLLASLICSVMFFLVTNFGVWLTSSMYPPTLSGLLESYFMGIPFFRNTVLGDLFYVGLFFGGWELLRANAVRYIPLPSVSK